MRRDDEWVGNVSGVFYFIVAVLWLFLLAALADDITSPAGADCPIAQRRVCLRAE